MGSEFEKTDNHPENRTDELAQDVENPIILAAAADSASENTIHRTTVSLKGGGGVRVRTVQRIQSLHGNAYTSRMLSVQRQNPYSGGSLPSPSYVNGVRSASMGGGGTASAGDSYFVTGGYQGQLVSRVVLIRDAYKAVDEVAKKLQKEGAGGFFGWGKDDQVLATAKNIQGTADGLVKIANAVDSWTGSPNKEAIEKGSRAAQYADNLIKAAEFVGSIKKLSTASDNLSDKPNQASVEAWADSIGDAFDKGSGLIGMIPSDGLPGFITDYYKGLFSAPKNYIKAFKTIMHARYEKIDMEAGVSAAEHAAWEPGKGNVWEGDLSGVYIGAGFQPRASSGATLQSLMLSHKTDLGVNLFKAPRDIGKALLQSAISSEAPEDVKVSWSDFMQSS